MRLKSINSHRPHLREHGVGCSLCVDGTATVGVGRIRLQVITAHTSEKCFRQPWQAHHRAAMACSGFMSLSGSVCQRFALISALNCTTRQKTRKLLALTIATCSKVRARGRSLRNKRARGALLQKGRGHHVAWGQSGVQRTCGRASRP